MSLQARLVTGLPQLLLSNQKSSLTGLHHFMVAGKPVQSGMHASATAYFKSLQRDHPTLYHAHVQNQSLFSSSDLLECNLEVRRVESRWKYQSF
jgi:hypothetical protein